MTSVVMSEQSLLCFLRNDVRTESFMTEEIIKGGLLTPEHVEYLSSILQNLMVSYNPHRKVLLGTKCLWPKFIFGTGFRFV